MLARVKHAQAFTDSLSKPSPKTTQQTDALPTSQRWHAVTQPRTLSAGQNSSKTRQNKCFKFRF